MLTMRILASDSEKMLTTERVAVAVIDLAAAVAQNDVTEQVEVLVVGPSGTPATAILLLGPGVQITLLPTDASGPPLDDDAAVDELQRRTMRHRPPPLSPDALDALAPDEAFPPLLGDDGLQRG